MNSLTVNLHLMMVSFYRPTPQRHKIVIEGGAFPSDQYAVKSQLRFHGFDPATSLIELTPRPSESTIRQEDIEALLEREGPSIALVLLGGVNYATGQLFDMEAITRRRTCAGLRCRISISHMPQEMCPLKLHDWDVDFAVWCSYKYLNGGPGCVADASCTNGTRATFDLPRFAGWWGHDQETRFLMGPDFHPMPGAEGWQLSNPSIMSMAPLRASLEIFAAAGMEQLREKSVSLTGYLEFLLDQHASDSFTHAHAARARAPRSAALHSNSRRPLHLRPVDRAKESCATGASPTFCA